MKEHDKRKGGLLMLYVVCDFKDGDLFTSEFDDLAKAVSRARIEYSRLSEHDKRKIYVLESADPNEESERHLDGDVVFSIGG